MHLIQKQLESHSKPTQVQNRYEPDVSELLRQANSEIKVAMYKLSRCVDSGNFHKILEHGVAKELQVIEKIPLCLKIDLQRQVSPLVLQFSNIKPVVDFKVYISYHNPEPSQNNFDFEFDNQKRIVIEERRDIDKKSNQK